MSKARLSVYLLILMSLLFMLSLAGCASETPVTEPEAPEEEAEAPEEEAAEPEPVELSFEAKEYINAEYGFSVKHPAVWVENPVTEGSPVVYYVVSEDSVPLMFIHVGEAATFEEALEGAIVAAEGSKVKIESKEEVKLVGGTDATRAIFKFNHPAVPLIALEAMAMGAQKDGKWVMVTVATLNAMYGFDEALFTEYVSTLKFD